MDRTVLVTVLGTRRDKHTYALHGSEATAGLATVALLSLLPDDHRPSEVVALCTPEALRETFPAMQQQLANQWQVRSVEIPQGRTEEEVHEYLRLVVEALEPDEGASVNLVLDLTHGFRHLPFLTYVAVLYLTALRNVRLLGAYYGMLESGRNVAPFLDLRPLLSLPHWFHAVEVLRRSGDVSPIAELIDAETSEQGSQQLAQDLRRLSRAYLAGQPLELGRLAARFRSQRTSALTKLFKSQHRLPLAKQLSGQIDESLRRFALSEVLPREGWKRRVVLDENELRRQAGLIDVLIERGHMSVALGLLREWVVSWALWQMGQTNGWLEREARQSAQNRLGALRAIATDPKLKEILTDDQVALAEFWAKLSDLRNAYHHHAMRREDMSDDKRQRAQFEPVRAYWGTTLRTLPTIDLQPGGVPEGCTLVSPIGRRPGVLFSAARVAAQEAIGGLRRCLVICSQSTRGSVAEALGHAALDPPPEVVCLELHDEFSGTDEFLPLVAQAKLHLVRSDRVLVNVTGGTTLMGLLAERIAVAARRLACPVRRFGLIDRRPVDEQDRQPYVEGEPFWLDRESADGDED